MSGFNPVLRKTDVNKLYLRESDSVGEVKVRRNDKPQDIYTEAEQTLKSYKSKFKSLSTKKKLIQDTINTIPTAIKHGLKLVDLMSVAGDDLAYKRASSFLNKLTKFYEKIKFKKITGVKEIRDGLVQLNKMCSSIELNEDKLKYLNDSGVEVSSFKMIDLPNKSDTMFWLEAPIVFVISFLSKSNQSRLSNGLDLKKLSSNYFAIAKIPFLVVKTEALRHDISLENQVNLVIQTLNKRKKGQRYVPVYSISRKINNRQVIMLCKEEFAGSLEELVNNLRSFKIYIQ